MRRAASLALVAALAAPVAVNGEVAPLAVDPRIDVPVTLAAAGVSLLLAMPQLAPPRCRFCAPNDLDEDVQESAQWRSPLGARRASDILANGVLPAFAIGNSILSAWRAGEPSAALEDGIVIAQAAAIAAALDGIAKDAVARRRPGAIDAPATGSGNTSFYSGHTSLAFSLATAAGTVSTLRGYPSAPYVWAVGMSLASGVGYLRVAGGAHWATDVGAGAAIGGLVGFGVPWLFHRAPGGAPPRYGVVPSPGGVAVLF